MSEFLDHLSANDNDIYDLMVSAKQRLTETVLRNLAKDRGIFLSPLESREDVADYLSQLPQGYHDVKLLLQKREPLNKREKSTFLRLNIDASHEEIKAAVASYRNAAYGERIVDRPGANGSYVIRVKYNEFNRAKTRLLQREEHEAEIEVVKDNGQTLIRLPSTDKARSVVSALKERLEETKKQKIDQELIELTALNSPELKSRFFTRLISQIPGFKLRNVMKLKVSLSHGAADDDDESVDLEDDQEKENAEEKEASAEMFAAVVHSMHLSGQNLVQSQEYKDLTARGFFITSISWRSEATGHPNDIVQFESSFQDRRAGTGFRYAAHGAFRSYKGGHRKTIDGLSDAEKTTMLTLIESTARLVLSELKIENSDNS